MRCVTDKVLYSKIVWERKEKIDLFDKLISENCSEETALQAINVSRATYYRWKDRFEKDGPAGLEPQSRRPNKVRTPEWSPELVKDVLEERKKFPILGKQKIAAILKRDQGISASESTIGRILGHLVHKNLVKPVGFYTGKYNPKPRIFNNHAQRIPWGMKAQKPGELVQVDHMTVQIDSGKYVKHFEAMCPTTRYSVGQAYNKASSLVAARFLDFLQQTLPFPLISIQVDGGSEFMGEFEKACKDRNIPLYVLPPRSPTMNAFVERGNGTVKYEFYSLYDKSDNLDSINASLKQYKQFYNSYRPHAGLQSLTPLEYWRKVGAL